MGEVIVITSGKGGVGKTTLAANIGAGLASNGKKTVLIDTDLGLRNLDILTGQENLIVYNLVDVIKGSCPFDQALLKHEQYDAFYLLPAAQMKDKSAITAEQLKKLAVELKEQFDYIILDCPPGIEQGFQNAVAAADRAFIVATPTVASVRAADRVRGLIEKNGLQNCDLILNRVRMDLIKRGDMMSIEDVTELFPMPLLGVLPEDEHVLVSENKKSLVLEVDCPTAKACWNICKRIEGEDVPFLDLGTGRHLFSKFSGIFRK